MRHLSPTLDPSGQIASSMAPRARQGLLYMAETRSEDARSLSTDLLIGGFNSLPLRRNVRHLSPTLDPLRQMAFSMAPRARQSVLHTATSASGLSRLWIDVNPSLFFLYLSSRRRPLAHQRRARRRLGRGPSRGRRHDRMLRCGTAPLPAHAKQLRQRSWRLYRRASLSSRSRSRHRCLRRGRLDVVGSRPVKRFPPEPWRAAASRRVSRAAPPGLASP